MKKSVILFSILLVLNCCTNYPANDDVNRELIPEPDKALREEYEKHQKELKEETIDNSTDESTQKKP
ncbi:MAG: hypothetical protein QE487_07650 [Fluviicola sp.]|nr:hypothetical protein [Fluviicola sp.]